MNDAEKIAAALSEIAKAANRVADALYQACEDRKEDAKDITELLSKISEVQERIEAEDDEDDLYPPNEWDPN